MKPRLKSRNHKHTPQQFTKCKKNSQQASSENGADANSQAPERAMNRTTEVFDYFNGVCEEDTPVNTIGSVGKRYRTMFFFASAIVMFYDC